MISADFYPAWSIILDQLDTYSLQALRSTNRELRSLVDEFFVIDEDVLEMIDYLHDGQFVQTEETLLAYRRCLNFFDDEEIDDEFVPMIKILARVYRGQRIPHDQRYDKIRINLDSLDDVTSTTFANLLASNKIPEIIFDVKQWDGVTARHCGKFLKIPFENVVLSWVGCEPGMLFFDLLKNASGQRM